MAYFFEQQRKARRKTVRLVFLFGLAVTGIVIGVYLIISGLIIYAEADHETVITSDMFIQPDLFITVAAFVSAVIFFVSFSKISSLKAGGKVVAESLGGRLIDPADRGRGYAQLLDVVEEMAIASGTPVPPVYVLEDEEGINAFAAGFSPDDAVIGVTRGAVRAFNREELQGVIAHEFSHILNGDMALNIKLIGYLAGIFSVAFIGRIFLIRAGRTRDRGAALLMMAGLGLLILGFTGVLIGRVIKAAVSREREYLADASSVQFTRNPAGIYSALAKIGGVKGSRIESEHAEEASHMFFSNAVKNLSGRLLSTHPAIESRLEAIRANAPEGLIQESAQHADKVHRDKERAQKGSADKRSSEPGDIITEKIPAHIRRTAAVAGAVIDSMGQIGDDHVALAGKIIEEIPLIVREAAHETYGARAVVYCLLLDLKDDEMREKQIGMLRSNADPGVFELVKRLEKDIASIPYYCRLPLVDMTLPALSELSGDQYRVFRANIRSLIEADLKFDLPEWALFRVLKNHLIGKFEGRGPVHEKYSLISKNAKEAAVTVFYFLADLSSDRSDIEKAFKKGLSEAGLSVGEISLNNKPGIGDFDRALDILKELKIPEKERFLRACAAIITSDGEINEKEAEVFRVIGDTLDSPVPLILPGQRLV